MFVRHLYYRIKNNCEKKPKKLKFEKIKIDHLPGPLAFQKRKARDWDGRGCEEEE